MYQSDQVLVPHSSIQLGAPVGEGLHAIVNHGIMKLDEKPGCDVALKIFQYLRAEPPVGVVKAFIAELEIIRHLKNEHIVQFRAVQIEPKLTIIMEYMNRGR